MKNVAGTSSALTSHDAGTVFSTLSDDQLARIKNVFSSAGGAECTNLFQRNFEEVTIMLLTL